MSIMSRSLRMFRRNAKLSVFDFSEVIGVSVVQTVLWELGAKDPDAEQKQRIATLYGVSVEDLAYGPHGAPAPAAGMYGDFARTDSGIVTRCEERKPYRTYARKMVSSICVPVTIAVYLLLGFVWGLWTPGWLVFFAIPVVTSALWAWETNDLRKFSYPLTVLAVYLYLGLEHALWHPYWFLFLTIPAFYDVASYLRFRRLGIYGSTRYIRHFSVIASLVASIVLGFATGAWDRSWLVFFAIPIAFGIARMIEQRNIRKFPILSVCTTVYLCIGFFTGVWHPTWILFFAAPVFWGAAKTLFQIQHRPNRPR